MKLIPLSAWAERVHGEYAPHPRTLLRWVKAKRIQPAPVKIGRGYYVEPEAVYTERPKTLWDRIRADEAKAHAR